MAWAKRNGTDPKYRTAEHRNRRAHLVRLIKAGEYVACTATVCLFARAPVTNTDGRDADGLHLGHHPDGVTYAGAQHNACNLHDAATRARGRRGKAKTAPWVR